MSRKLPKGKSRSTVTGRYVSKSTVRKTSSTSAPSRNTGGAPKKTAVPGQKVGRVATKLPKLSRSIAPAQEDVTGLDQLDPSATTARDATHLRRITAAARGLEKAEAELRSAVDAARADGESWAVIGAALGVSRQGAYQRFGR